MYDIKDFQNTTKFIESICVNWNASKQRSKMIIAKKYYEGKNETIENVKKEVVIKSKDNHYRKENNPFVSNFKIGDNFVADMIDQKVFTLLDKAPSVLNVNDTTEKLLSNTLDYTLQQMSIEASLCGTAFAFVKVGNPLEFKVFDTEHCIPFYDFYNDKLEALIRHWTKKELLTNNQLSLYEVYSNDGYLYTYEKREDKEITLIGKQSFISNIKGNAYVDEVIDTKWQSGFPIVELKNNKDRTSDFKRSIREQIDAIDIVSSDFCNNLADFQDVFWVIKGLDHIEAEHMGEFMQQIKNTYKANVPEGVEVDMQQIEIPYQARKEFVDMMKKKLIANAGVLDTELILTGGLTATAIKAASTKLKTKVSKFEYEVYKTALQMIYFVKESINDAMDNNEIEIKFYKNFINNDTEIINNLVTSQSMLSEKTILEIHPYVEDVEEEIKRKEKENESRFSVQEPIEEPPIEVIEE